MSDERLIIRDGEADTAAIAAYEATRRDAVRRGLLAGGAVLSASMIPTLLKVRSAFAESDTSTATGDAGILEGAVGLEQTAVVAYATIAKSGLLGPATSVVELFGKQEAEHADALIAALKSLGSTVPPPPKPTDIPGMTEVKTDQQALAFAVELENMALATYVEAAKELESGDLLKAVSQIVCDEGQHLVVLRQALGSNPLPAALPSGSEKG